MYRLDQGNGGLAVKLNPEAIVWRHWYSTFGELASALPLAQRENVVAAPLPGGLNLAGEWYLAVPPRSAAPDCAMEIIQEITKPEAALERLNRGVGLPARSSFYNVAPPVRRDWHVHLHDLAIDIPSLRSLIESPIFRSSFRGYPQIATSLSAHLLRIIELQEEPWHALQRRISGILENVNRQLRFLDPSDNDGTASSRLEAHEVCSLGGSRHSYRARKPVDSGCAPSELSTSADNPDGATFAPQ
jgi:hypothetical protein